MGDFKQAIAQFEGLGTEQTMEDEETKKKKKKKDDGEFFDLTIDKLNDKFFSRLFINFLSVLLLVRFIYYKTYQDGEFFFTFLVFNMVIFLITYLLNKVDMSLGAAFGLFAVFSMLRYRTEGISAREMTYLFVVIAIGLITAVAKGTALELGLINILIITLVYVLESNLFMRREFYHLIQYENIELIRKENHVALLEDLKKRTGLPIHRFSVVKIDFLRDSAQIRIYYYADKKK